MSNNAAINSRFTSGWQILADFSVTSSRGGEQQLANQACETVRVLGLQPQQLERIRKALSEAFSEGTHRDHVDGQIFPVHIRIWVAGNDSHGRGWGFFLVKKQGCELQSATVRINSLVELFLYQELLR